MSELDFICQAMGLGMKYLLSKTPEVDFFGGAFL